MHVLADLAIEDELGLLFEWGQCAPAVPTRPALYRVHISQIHRYVLFVGRTIGSSINKLSV